MNELVLGERTRVALHRVWRVGLWLCLSAFWDACWYRWRYCSIVRRSFLRHGTSIRWSVDIPVVDIVDGNDGDDGDDPPREMCVCVCVCVGWNTSSTTACNRHVMLVMVGHECVLFQPPSDAAQLERRGMTVPIEPIWTEDAYTSGKNTLSGAHQVRSAYSFVLFFGHWRVDD